MSSERHQPSRRIDNSRHPGDNSAQDLNELSYLSLHPEIRQQARAQGVELIPPHLRQTFGSIDSHRQNIEQQVQAERAGRHHAHHGRQPRGADHLPPMEISGAQRMGSEVSTPDWFPIRLRANDQGVAIGLNAFGLAEAGLQLGARTGPYAGSAVFGSYASAGLDVRSDPYGRRVEIGPGAGYTALYGLSGADAGLRASFTPQSIGFTGDARAQMFNGQLGFGSRSGLDIGGYGIAPRYDGYTQFGPERYIARFP
jgi:hypothetical protein